MQIFCTKSLFKITVFVNVYSLRACCVGVLTWAAERLLGCDAPVAGGAEGGGGHRQGGEEVAVTGPCFSFSRLLVPLLQTLLLLVLRHRRGRSILALQA